MALRKIRLVWWVSAACPLVLLAVIVFALVRGWTPSKVERTVNSELPRGSSRERIEAFLDAHRWTHYRCETIDDANVMWLAKKAKLDIAKLSGAVVADVSDANVGILSQGSITVVFFLGPDGRMVKSYVSVWILSL
jgi:hypothetical protein